MQEESLSISRAAVAASVLMSEQTQRPSTYTYCSPLAMHAALHPSRSVTNRSSVHLAATAAAAAAAAEKNLPGDVIAADSIRPVGPFRFESRMFRFANHTHGFSSPCIRPEKEQDVHMLLAIMSLQDFLMFLFTSKRGSSNARFPYEDV